MPRKRALMAGKKKKKTKEVAKPKDEKYKPTDAERTLLEDYANKQSQRHPAPRLKVRESSDKVITTIPDHPDHDVWAVGFNKAMGSTENSFATYSFDQIINALTRKGEDASDMAERLGDGLGNTILATMHGIAPKDEVEGMLAAQMMAVHHAAMNLMRRMHSVDTLEQFGCHANQVNKFMRTYTAQMEALKRYRAKANQTVRVERVYVNEGGQAVVGNVNTGGEGGHKTKGQPHEQVTHAPGTPMPSQDEAENVVPVPGNEKRKVPAPRG